MIFQFHLLVSCLLVLSLLLNVRRIKSEENQWLFQSEAKWDREWKSGEWNYLEKVAVERSRIAVIGGVLVQMYSSPNASVLDIGCGEGPIADFLTSSQKTKYVGVDISNEAIHNAKKLRPPPLKFVHATAHRFLPKNKFDVIIFSDVLYYVEYEKVLNQYIGYLNPDGIIIISIFFQADQKIGRYENIFQYARTTMTKLDEMDVSGFTKKGKSTTLERTAFHIEVYRKKT
jgi:2-polyprenyl-3-methyl-5-hydroxy-6-metoxy-1,4-benzoquinol methylase